MPKHGLSRFAICIFSRFPFERLTNPVFLITKIGRNEGVVVYVLWSLDSKNTTNKFKVGQVYLLTSACISIPTIDKISSGRAAKVILRSEVQDLYLRGQFCKPIIIFPWTVPTSIHAFNRVEIWNLYLYLVEVQS